MILNPFTTSGYISPEYFCDRQTETENLLRQITNGNNVAMISTRRMGKTGLIQHCFHTAQLKENYYLFLIDIYSTKTLRDFVYQLGKTILEVLKPKGRRAWELFLGSLASLRTSVSFDSSGMPTWSIELGDIHSPTLTLDEIFRYLEQADKPCIVAIDEFQQVRNYPEGNIEAVLRTHIQHCKNARFIFAGSQRHLMGDMFINPSRPFYQSVSIMHLAAIDMDNYHTFAQHHFEAAGKIIEPEVITLLYQRFEGITWYIQKLLNILFSITVPGETCRVDSVDTAIRLVLEAYDFTYSELLYQIPEKQKEILIAICKEGKAQNVTSARFVKKYRLPSGSSVQAALKGLLDKDFITKELGIYQVYDRFFALWLERRIL
ncbi:MAG: ATPase [Mediterranea sp.]|jgi:AAA+ ATPase superfamily predicted ATPase|nr:ATPase [Mediterranea sp.]